MISDKKSTATTNSLSTLRDRNPDTIPFRIDYIKALLENKELKPMIDFDNTETEYFLNKKNNMDSNDFNSSIDSHDTRGSLNKKILDFNNVFKQIGGRLKYIKSGTTGHTFKGIIEDPIGEFNYAVKVVAYPRKEKYGNINDTRRPENAELMMIKLLSYFVIKKYTPHIVLPIGTFNTSINPFLSLVHDDIVDEDNKKYAEFLERHNKNEYHNNVSILISEWANRGDFLDFLRKNYKKFLLIHWKVFFFQIISALAVIQSKFPGFRHNDLKANNILVNKIDKSVEVFSYLVSYQKYYVPNISYQIKLWDFDFACIPGVVENSKVSSEWTKAINVTPTKNRYYDVHYFFNTLIRKGFFPQVIEDSSVPQEVKDFIYRVVPQKYREGKNVHKRGRILVNDEYLIPDEILKTDPFFEEFRNHTHIKKRNTSKKENIDKNKIYKSNKTNEKEDGMGNYNKNPERIEKKNPIDIENSKIKKKSKEERIDVIKLEDLLNNSSD